MSDAPVVFDPAALKRRVSESVTATFGMLIPQSEWDTLVEREVKAFFEEVNDPWVIIEQRGSWNTSETQKVQSKLTPFRVLVWKHLGDLCLAKVQECLSTDKFLAIVNREYTSGGEVQKDAMISDFLLRKLDEIAPAMAASMFRSMFVAAVQTAKDETLTAIRNGVR